MDQWIDKWMDQWMDGWIDKWMDGLIDGWMQIDGRLLPKTMQTDKHTLLQSPRLDVSFKLPFSIRSLVLTLGRSLSDRNVS